MRQFWSDYKIVIITLAAIFCIYGGYRGFLSFSNYEQSKIDQEVNSRIANLTSQNNPPQPSQAAQTETLQSPTSTKITAVPSNNSNSNQAQLSNKTTQTAAPSVSNNTPSPTVSNLSAPIPNLSNASQYTKSVIELVCPDILKSGSAMEGSGSIINNSGYILTNKHLLVGYNNNSLYLGFYCTVYTTNPNNLSSPQASYIAYPVSILTDYDAAILRIVKDVNGVSVDSLLNFVPLTLNDQLPKVGDRIFAIGYPAIGSMTFNFTSGEVTGFYNSNGQNMIKIDSLISHGNSGGAVLDTNGRLVGIPTAMATDEGGSIGYALAIHDIAQWANSVIQNTKTLSSQTITSRSVDIIANPYPVINSYTNSTNNREFVITGNGFCDNNVNVSSIILSGSYTIPVKNIISWSDTEIDFSVPLNISSGIYTIKITGYKTGVGYCPAVNAGGITVP